MAEIIEQVDIPNRALFRGAEVCELLQVQPYVLRTWETEFPALGVARNAGGPRVYRRADLEQVMRIKHLLLIEGLTLAGARRRLEEEAAPVAVDMPLDELIGRDARDRLTEVKRGLQSILEMLAGQHGGDGRHAQLRVSTAPRAAASSRGRTAHQKSRTTDRRAASKRKRSR